jgi:hypothetical protein
MRSPGALDLLLDVLSHDRDLAFSIDLPEVIVELGDARAVPALAGLLAEPLPDRSADDVLLRRDGVLRHARAALALGAFDTPGARRALRAHIGDPELGPACALALYRLTGQRSRLRAVARALEADHDLAPLVTDALLRAGDQESLLLAERWQRASGSEPRPVARSAGSSAGQSAPRDESRARPE